MTPRPRRRKPFDRLSLALAPADVAQKLIGDAKSRLDEVYGQYQRMLRDPAIDYETRLVVVGKMTDIARQMTELATTVTSTFGKQAAKPISALPAAATSGGDFASPPRPGEPIMPTVYIPQQEPQCSIS